MNREVLRQKNVFGNDRSTELATTYETKETPDASAPSSLSPPVSPSSSPPSPTVEVLVDGTCFWIHNALGIDEQIEVFREIRNRSKHIDNSQKTPCMNPTPKTLLFDGHAPTLRFGKPRSNSDDEIHKPSMSASLSSVFERLILRRAMALVSQHLQPPSREASPSRASDGSGTGAVESSGYDRYAVGVIRYPAPNGNFPEHIDHCNDPGARVVLLSLGCNATFSVRGPHDASKKFLKLASGDVVVFDPSTEAAVRHGVVSVEASTCPGAMAGVFEGMLARHRYGVQCRTSCSDPSRSESKGRGP